MKQTAATAKRPTVLIVGHGEMGHAMQVLLRNRARLITWRVTPEKQQLSRTASIAARRCAAVMLCVPTAAHPPLLTQLAPRLNPRSLVLSVAKGLDDHGRPAAGILNTVFGKRGRWGVLGGPMIAEELRAGRTGYAQLGSNSRRVFCRAAALFRGTRLHLVPSSTPLAVSWCGVFKNTYAPLFGISEARGWGDNARGRLGCTVLAEMNRLVLRCSGVRDAANAEAGLADLLTTVTSAGSHHLAIGRRVARGATRIPTGEGIHSLNILRRQGVLLTPDVPLLRIAAGLACRPAEVPRRLYRFLNSPGGIRQKSTRS